MNFSQDKLDMLPTLSQMFVDPEKEILRIQGPPGCGKTAVIELIVRHYLSFFQLMHTIDPETKKQTSDNIFLCATTNKATAVIEEEVAIPLLPEFGILTCQTIYTLLSLKVFNDFQTGETRIQRSKGTGNRYFAKNSLVIIDEASYTDYSLWFHMKNQLIGRGLNIILIADYYQSTPVNCSVSPIFDPSIPVYTLTERFRYPVGSAIHLNSLTCEKAIDTGKVDRLLFDGTCERIRSTDMPALIKDHLVDNDRNTRILAYRNQVVVDYNNDICKQKYGDTGFHVGQEVVFNRFYNFNNFPIHNEQKGVISQIGPPRASIEGIMVNDITFDGNFTVPVPVSFAQFRAALNRAKADRDWKIFYEIQESLVDIRHAWASTVHKAQGSTYDYCILDFNDLLNVTNLSLFYRLLNVAMTRPRIKVFICKD